MKEIDIWGWDKKVRTMLRFLKSGDIFCFKFDEKYAFGRILTSMSVGHLVEIFDIILPTTEITEKQVINANSLVAPIVIDAYSLFDRKEEGEWRIIGRQKQFIPQNIDDVFFIWGAEGMRRRVDFYDNSEPVSDEVAQNFPLFYAQGNDQVIGLIKSSLAK